MIACHHHVGCDEYEWSDGTRLKVRPGAVFTREEPNIKYH